MKKYLISALVMLTFALVGCDNDYEPGGTATQALSGDWWVTYFYEDNGEWVQATNPCFLSTYNTAANTSSEMFIDDHATFWQYKAKIKASPDNLSFGSDGECENFYYDSKIKVYDGKIFKGQGHSQTGVVTDSISFKIWFDDAEEAGDPAEWLVTGHRRTGFIEDEY